MIRYLASSGQDLCTLFLKLTGIGLRSGREIENMIIVDTQLKLRHAQGNPVRIGMVRAGYMARGILLQIQSAMPGLRVVGVAARNVQQAESAYALAGITPVRAGDSPDQGSAHQLSRCGSPQGPAVR